MAGKRIAVLSLFALVALALTVFASSSTEAGSYKVRTSYYLSSSAPSATSDNTIYVTIPAPDYNYEDSSMFTFGPIDGWVTPGGAIPIGAGAGVLSSMSVLGLFNGPCTSIVAPYFPLWNATVDTTKIIGKDLMAWTNTANPISYRFECSDNKDNDGDTLVNDGCPASGPAETGTNCTEVPASCADTNGFPPWDNCDDDGESPVGFINDGCPKLASDNDTTDAAETTAGRRVNDGCPAVGTSEKPTAGWCANDLDDDGDTTVNDGCDQVGTIAESGAQCIDAEVSSDVTLPDYVEYYPYFLNSMLDPDGSGPLLPLKPRARYAGDGLVSSSNMLIEVIILNPGQITQLPGIKAQMVAGLGYVIITALNNPWDQVELPGAVSDFCSPMASITTIYGMTTDNPATTTVNEAGFLSQRNPPATSGVLATGTLMSRNFSMGERDVDADGWENDLDPCFYTLDPLWDPRVTCVHPGAGDHDCDGLPDSCDPFPETFNEDQDGDLYKNRQDICPLVANGEALDNQADTDSTVQGLNADLGPGPDSIGDACDDSDDDGNEDGGAAGDCNDGSDNGGVDGLIDGNDPDCIAAVGNNWTGMDKGEVAHWGSTSATVWGTTPGSGFFWHSMPWTAVCVGGAESGTQCTAGNLLDEDTDGRFNDGCPAVSAPETVCNETACANLAACDNDSDGSANDGCPGVIGSLDADNDGYCDALETLLSSPTNNGPEIGAQCVDAEDASCVNKVDDDGDTNINDGCPTKVDPENPSCVNAIDDDAADDAPTPRINDGCPIKGPAPEDEATQCNDDVDNDADTRVNDGCPAVNNAENPECADDADNDGDTRVNDGCPTKGDPENGACAEITCASVAACDNDSDGLANDGCPKKAKDDDTADAEETIDPEGRKVNDGCPAVGIAESVCTGDVDDDGDTTTNDGCIQVGTISESTILGGCTDPENPATQCADAVDDDGDTNINDGCPAIGLDDDSDGNVNDGCPMKGTWAEVGVQCNNNTSEDTPSPDLAEPIAYVNDGCPVIGVPESLVIDGMMNSPAALPSASPPASCSDGVDNDNDGELDADDDDDALGCDSGDASYTGDTDLDGVKEASGDNCGNLCANNTDDDADGKINDGCPVNVAAETTCGELTCPDADATPNAPPWATCDDDADGKINDGCAAAGPAPALAEVSSHLYNPEQTNTEAILLAGGAKLMTSPNTPLPTDSAGDACDGDDDNDGYSDIVESYMGTDPVDNCSDVYNVTGKTDAWALDINRDQFATMADVNNYAGKLSRKVSGDTIIPAPASWALARLDFNKDNFVTMADVNKYAGWLSKKCA